MPSCVPAQPGIGRLRQLRKARRRQAATKLRLVARRGGSALAAEARVLTEAEANALLTSYGVECLRRALVPSADEGRAADAPDRRAGCIKVPVAGHPPQDEAAARVGSRTQRAGGRREAIGIIGNAAEPKGRCSDQRRPGAGNGATWPGNDPGALKKRPDLWPPDADGGLGGHSCPRSIAR